MIVDGERDYPAPPAPSWLSVQVSPTHEHWLVLLSSLRYKIYKIKYENLKSPLWGDLTTVHRAFLMALSLCHIDWHLLPLHPQKQPLTLFLLPCTSCNCPGLYVNGISSLVSLTFRSTCFAAPLLLLNISIVCFLFLLSSSRCRHSIVWMSPNFVIYSLVKKHAK